jgi:hypothetical protein
MLAGGNDSLVNCTFRKALSQSTSAEKALTRTTVDPSHPTEKLKLLEAIRPDRRPMFHHLLCCQYLPVLPTMHLLDTMDNTTTELPPT